MQFLDGPVVTEWSKNNNIPGIPLALTGPVTLVQFSPPRLIGKKREGNRAGNFRVQFVDHTGALAQ